MATAIQPSWRRSAAASEAFDQIIFAEYTHEPAEQLARGLIAIAPPGLAHVFYSDSGSTAVEVALKMALGFFHNQGRPRSRIVVMEHGYHGDTIGTMSTGERGVFNAAYRTAAVRRRAHPLPRSRAASRRRSMPSRAPVRAGRSPPCWSNHWCSAQAACGCIRRMSSPS